MKHIPILFSTEMVQAILDNRKKMTRRVSKHQYWSHSELVDVNINKITSKTVKNVSCKYGNIGDILWVRESFYKPHQKVMFGDYWYKADLTPQGWDFKWKPSIHMPKSACRIFLRVTDVRCERLQDISEQDAVDEGILYYGKSVGAKTQFKNYYGTGGWLQNPIISFESLWASINGQESWDDNPYVWVVSFERCERPADFLNH
jgi:hypothetical protein